VIAIPKVLVTEEQWIRIGMEQFARSGADGLVIEQMASELGCSKSSFYWYFKNRKDYIVRIVERWSDVATQQIIRQSAGSGTAEDQVDTLLTEMFAITQKGDFLFYLRRLARENADYRAILDAIEQARMQYAQELLMKLGMPLEAAERKSRILYHYYLGWYERHKHEPVREEDLKQHVGMLRTHLLGI
jgi:AcrR family transcriptional regulator